MPLLILITAHTHAYGPCPMPIHGYGIRSVRRFDSRKVTLLLLLVRDLKGGEQQIESKPKEEDQIDV